MSECGRRWQTALALMVAVLCLCFATTAGAVTGQQVQGELPRDFDCRYGQSVLTGVTEGEDWEHFVVPRDDVFRPLLAYSKEPRFAGNFPWAVFERDLSEDEGFEEFVAANVTLAESGGFWSVRRRGTCNGFQINVFGGVFSQFALNPLYLLNSDYVGGLSKTFGWDRFSARLRVYHQSSHIGDDFLLENVDFETVNLSFEAVDFLVSFSGSWWRLYGGGGYIFRADPVEMDRIMVQVGGEMRAETWGRQSFIPNLRWTPVAGVDLTSFQTRDWGVTWNTKAGVELLGNDGLGRSRIMASMLYGYTPYGQFFDEHQLTSLGLEAQFMF